MKNSTRLRNIFLFLVGLLILVGIFTRKEEKTHRTVYGDADRPTHQDSIQRLFDPWDGSHITLTKYLKEHLNDPDSYEHVKTEYKDLGEILVVVTTYRAKNGFGAKILSSITAESDMKGNIKVFDKDK